MAGRYTESAIHAKLLTVPVNAEPRVALEVVQANFDIVWKTLKDLIGRMDVQK